MFLRNVTPKCATSTTSHKPSTKPSTSDPHSSDDDLNFSGLATQQSTGGQSSAAQASQRSSGGHTGEFDGNDQHSDPMMNALQNTFGLQSLRPIQMQIINAALNGNDCFVIMPTGGGKSLCFQLPAVLSDSITLVISPLKSLITDQVNKLQAMGISVRNLSGPQTAQELSDIYTELETSPPQIKLLYVTPEKISQSGRLKDLMVKLYESGRIARFVIDEAHCIR